MRSNMTQYLNRDRHISNYFYSYHVQSTLHDIRSTAGDRIISRYINTFTIYYNLIRSIFNCRIRLVYGFWLFELTDVHRTMAR